jgi:hypothetical protein
MLRKDVVAAVKENRFRIYAVKTIDEGIEILTGMPAGEKQPDGTYPQGTINFLVDRRLANLAEDIRKFGGSAGEEIQKKADRQKS